MDKFYMILRIHYYIIKKFIKYNFDFIIKIKFWYDSKSIISFPVSSFRNMRNMECTFNYLQS